MIGKPLSIMSPVAFVIFQFTHGKTSVLLVFDAFKIFNMCIISDICQLSLFGFRLCRIGMPL